MMNIETVRKKLEQFQSKPEILERLVKQYQSFGYVIKPGDIFYQTMHGGEKVWGLKVGQFTHSCHVDTTEFIVIFFVFLDNNKLQAIPDFALLDSVTV